MDANHDKSPINTGNARQRINLPPGSPRWDMVILGGFWLFVLILGLLIALVMPLLQNR